MPEYREFICKLVKLRYGGMPAPSDILGDSKLPILLPERVLTPVLARPGPYVHKPPGRRGLHWKVRTHSALAARSSDFSRTAQRRCHAYAMHVPRWC
jgi:hypothetical protein